MHTPENYPLDQLHQIKKKRLQEAEKILREKKESLKKEEETLAIIEEERNETLRHRELKLQQLRSELDQGTTSDKVQQMKAYLKVVEEKLKIKETKVQEQKKIVAIATKAVESARQELVLRQKNVEKLDIHRQEWDKEIQVTLEHKEALLGDEMGANQHERNRRHKKNK